MTARVPAALRREVKELHGQIETLALLVPEGIPSIRRVVDGLIRHEMFVRMYRDIAQDRATFTALTRCR